MKNNSVMQCCICNNEKTGEFIVIEGKKYHLGCISEIQKNNEELKKQIKDKKLIQGCECCEWFGICPHSYNGYDYKSQNEAALDKIQRIIDFGSNYDGYNTTENFERIMKTLLYYAKQSKEVLNGTKNQRKVISQNSLLKVKDKNFKCSCGCNVFTHYDNDDFECHLCGKTYNGCL